MKKVLAISLAVLFAVSFTAVAASAEREGYHGHGGFGSYGCGYGCGYPCVLVPYCGYMWNPCTNMFVWTC